MKIDSTTVGDDEYARFTANGLESRSTGEVLSDIGGVTAADASNDATACNSVRIMIWQIHLN